MDGWPVVGLPATTAAGAPTAVTGSLLALKHDCSSLLACNYSRTAASVYTHGTQAARSLPSHGRRRISMEGLAYTVDVRDEENFRIKYNNQLLRFRVEPWRMWHIDVIESCSHTSRPHTNLATSWSTSSKLSKLDRAVRLTTHKTQGAAPSEDHIALELFVRYQSKAAPNGCAMRLLQKLFKAGVARTPVRSVQAIRAYASEPSAKEIAEQQHSGSRSTPRPTEATKTSTQRPNDPPQGRPPQGQALPESQQQKVAEDEPGSKRPMAETHDDPSAELKGNTPFRAAPIEKSAG